MQCPCVTTDITFSKILRPQDASGAVPCVRFQLQDTVNVADVGAWRDLQDAQEAGTLEMGSVGPTYPDSHMRRMH